VVVVKPAATGTAETTIHTAPWVLAGSNLAFRHGAVAVAHGNIVQVGRFDDVRRDLSAGCTVVEWPGALIPGLVNAHTHLQYTDMSELGTRSYPSFEAWSTVFAADYANRRQWRQSAERGLDAVLRAGTTAVSDVVTHVEALDVLWTGGLHGIAFWEVIGMRYTDWTDRGRQQTVEILDSAAASSYGAVGLSPHAPYSLDGRVLAEVSALSRARRQRSHIHLAESRAEYEYVVRAAGPLADFWRNRGYGDFSLLRQGGAGTSPVAYAASAGVLDSCTHIAHGVYVDEDDREILRRTGTVVALCPRSNAVLGLDDAPVADYLREGNHIAVGTDSLSSSPSLDVLADTAELYRIARRQGYHQRDLHCRLFHAVTAGGAEAMGLADRIGSLEPGRSADMAVIDVDASRAHDICAAIVEGGGGMTEATIVAGEVRFRRARRRTATATAGGAGPPGSLPAGAHTDHVG
jgi:cytosine/adenosine deaminase-related metal-dependent hydrolase